jgi:hypothetical protein
MRAPRRGYASLSVSGGTRTWLGACVRPVVAWAVLGASLTIMGTGHISGGSFLPTLAWWVWLPIGQVLIALTVIRGAAARAIGMARALDLFFMGHAPWSLWLLATAAWTAFTSPTRSLILPVPLLGIVPLVWTQVILFAYCREILRLDARAARRRVLLHQGITWGLVVSTWGTAVQLWPRFLGALGQ